MNTINSITIVGEIDEDGVTRKTVDSKTEKNVRIAEFRISGIGLRITAFGNERADAVPDEGVVVVQGFVSTRHYEYNGDWRSSTEIKATSVQFVAGGEIEDEEEPEEMTPTPAAKPAHDDDLGF